MKSLRELHAELVALGMLELPAASIKAFLDGHATLLKLREDKAQAKAKLALDSERLELDRQKLELEREKLGSKALSATTTYQGNIYAPNVVYEIRCSANGMKYIGVSAKGFIRRYPEGFYTNHHNPFLAADIKRYGNSAFQVRIIECESHSQAEAMEARVLAKADQLMLYNIRLEG